MGWREDFEKLISSIGEIYKNTDKYMSVYSIDRIQAENEIRYFQQIIKKAALGDHSAVMYIVDQYTKLLHSDTAGIDSKEVYRLIDFNNILENDICIIYEILLSVIDISIIIEEYITEFTITERAILNAVYDNKDYIDTQYEDRRERIRLISYIAYTMEYGQDALDSLQYHDINEIGAISCEYIYIGYKGNKYHIDFLKLPDTNNLENIQKKTTRNAVLPYDRQTPAVIGAKSNSNRITVAGYDASPSADILYYNERIFNIKNIRLEEMRDKYLTIDDNIYRFLLLNQKGRGSFFVSGSDMGVGKSTFLLSMLEKVPDKWGIGIIDTQNELQAFRKFKRNIITIIENPKISVSRAFELLLKMARDVLGVGEITKPEEAAELLNAALRLNAGAFATIHSYSAFEVVANLRNLMLRTKMYNDSYIAESDISRGLDLIIHMERHPHDRKRIIVQNIVEVVYTEDMDDEYADEKLFGDEKDTRLLIKNALEKYISGRSYKYNELFRFNESRDGWDIINPPSRRYKGKIDRLLSDKEKKSLNEMFCGEKEENLVEAAANEA